MVPKHIQEMRNARIRSPLCFRCTVSSYQKCIAIIPWDWIILPLFGVLQPVATCQYSRHLPTLACRSKEAASTMHGSILMPLIGASTNAILYNKKRHVETHALPETVIHFNVFSVYQQSRRSATAFKRITFVRDLTFSALSSSVHRTTVHQHAAEALGARKLALSLPDETRAKYCIGRTSCGRDEGGNNLRVILQMQLSHRTTHLVRLNHKYAVRIGEGW